MKLLDLFESVKEAVLYHATNLECISNILTSNSLRADTNHIESLINPSLKSNKMISGVSLTRDKKFADEWADVILVLDLNKLRQNYKIKQVSYFNDGETVDRTESEEFIIGNINNLDRYLVDIYFPKRLEKNYTNIAWVEKNIKPYPKEYEGWKSLANNKFFKNKINESLLESKSANLYHSTAIRHAIKIIEENYIKDATPHIINDKTQNGVSLTRDINFAKLWKTDYIRVIFCFDQQKLSQRYKILPIDYFSINDIDEAGNDDIIADEFRRRDKYAEAEEFVIGAISPVDKYLKAIYITQDCKKYLEDGTRSSNPSVILNHPKLRIIDNKMGVRVNESNNQLEFQERMIAAQELKDKVIETRQKLQIDGNGYITLYHATSEKNAQSIMNNGKFHSQSFFAPSKAQTLPHARPKHGKDTITISIKVDPRDIEFSTGTGEFYCPHELIRNEYGIWETTSL